jgi:hypothetical protein
MSDDDWKQRARYRLQGGEMDEWEWDSVLRVLLSASKEGCLNRRFDEETGVKFSGLIRDRLEFAKMKDREDGNRT